MGRPEQEGIYHTASTSAEPTGTGSRGERFLGKHSKNSTPTNESGTVHVLKKAAVGNLGPLAEPAREHDVFQKWSHDNRQIGGDRDVNPDFNEEELAGGYKIIRGVFEANGIDNSRDRRQLDLQLKLTPLIRQDVRNFETFENKIKSKIETTDSLIQFRRKMEQIPDGESVFIHSIKEDEQMFITSTDGIGEHNSKILIGKRKKAGSTKGDEKRLTLEEILKDRLHEMYGINENPAAIEYFDGVFSSEIGYMAANQRKVLKILHHYKPQIKEIQRKKAESEKRKPKSETLVYDSNNIGDKPQVQRHIRANKAA